MSKACSGMPLNDLWGGHMAMRNIAENGSIHIVVSHIFIYFVLDVMYKATEELKCHLSPTRLICQKT